MSRISFRQYRGRKELWIVIECYYSFPRIPCLSSSIPREGLLFRDSIFFFRKWQVDSFLGRLESCLSLETCDDPTWLSCYGSHRNSLSRMSVAALGTSFANLARYFALSLHLVYLRKRKKHCADVEKPADHRIVRFVRELLLFCTRMLELLQQ